MTSIPDIKQLAQLEVLDLKGNNINVFPNDLNKNLVDIDLEENPIVGFDFIPESLPKLKTLKIGSPSTKFLSLQILEQYANKELEIEMSRQHVEHLLFPTPIDWENLRTFVDDASLDLTNIPTNKRRETFEWVVRHSGSLLKGLIISYPKGEDCTQYQNDIDHVKDTFDAELGNLRSLRQLSVNNLGLHQFNDLSELTNLTWVNYSNNNIAEPDYSMLPRTSLQMIDLSLNP